jgi:hypothetical protein
LALTIPTRAEECPQAVATAECFCVVNKSVPRTLTAAANYDPRAFRDHCRQLAKRLTARTTAAGQ